MSSSGTKILAVDDNAEALFVLEEMLKRHGFAVVTAGNGKEALKQAESEQPDIVLLDVNMPGMDGYEVTRTLKSDSVLRYSPVVLLTALDKLEDVVRGLDQGADDYLVKPYKSEELLARVRAAMRTRATYLELRSETRAKKALEHQLSNPLATIIGESAPMKQTLVLMEKVKDAAVPVLILGKSGTGKEVVARWIHYHSVRRERPFVVQNCSALNENLLESEPFGHVRGAFTGAVRDKEGLFSVADTGTFFLDELGEMSPALQVKLLRVLQQGTFMPVGGTKEKKVDVRVVAATNRDLPEMVQQGKFREDLFYRLNVVTINLPQLRERREDIKALVPYFLKRAAERTGKQKKVSAQTLQLLCAYDWPGNIRELENEIERLVLLSGEEAEIGSDALSAHIVTRKSPLEQSAPLPVGTNLKSAIEELERKMIAATLNRLRWNKSEAARELGISRSSLIAKVQAYGLEGEPEKS